MFRVRGIIVKEGTKDCKSQRWHVTMKKLPDPAGQLCVGTHTSWVVTACSSKTKSHCGQGRWAQCPTPLQRKKAQIGALKKKGEDKSWVSREEGVDLVSRMVKVHRMKFSKNLLNCLSTFLGIFHALEKGREWIERGKERNWCGRKGEERKKSNSSCRTYRITFSFETVLDYRTGWETWLLWLNFLDYVISIIFIVIKSVVLRNN